MILHSAKPCVQCGFCCKQGICAFGEWDQKNHQCSFLKDNLCNKYEFIIETGELQNFSPAFGAGCCSVFNEDRIDKILKIRKKIQTEKESLNDILPPMERTCYTR